MDLPGHCSGFRPSFLPFLVELLLNIVHEGWEYAQREQKVFILEFGYVKINLSRKINFLAWVFRHFP